jgi:chitin deacetylase
MRKRGKLLLYIALIACTFYAAYRISSSRTFQFFGEIVSRVETDEKIVALTFDDGPSKNTDSVLNLLRELDVKATFFVTGGEMQEDPGRGRRIAAEGHELGNHTYSHPRMVFKSPEYIRQQIEKTDELIRKAGHSGEIFFRPPGCKKLLLLPWYLSRNNRVTVTWDIEPDSIQGIMDDPDKIAENILHNAKPGSIILLHVMYDSRKPSVEALPGIVSGLRKKGYRLVTLSELLKDRR